MDQRKKADEPATELEDHQLDQAGGRATSGDADDRPTEEVSFAYAKAPKSTF